MKLNSILWSGLFLLSVTAQAEEPVFGTVGELIPSGSVSILYSQINPLTGDSVNVVDVRISPQIMYFVAENLALGSGVLLDSMVMGEGDKKLTMMSYGISPRIAYNVRFADNLSMFPSLALDLSLGKARYGTDTTRDTQNRSLSMNIFIPVLFHFGNFFLGAGPNVDATLISKEIIDNGESKDATKYTTVGLGSTFGGHF